MSTNPFGDQSSQPFPNSTGGNFPPPGGAPAPVLAIVSLVCGIIGIFPGCCCVLIGVPFQLGALITGGIVIANPTAPGRPMAIGGVVLGVIGLLWVAFALVLNLMNPDLARQIQEMQQMQQNR